MERMGFYLWLDEQLAWAQGTYEYRPMAARGGLRDQPRHKH